MGFLSGLFAGFFRGLSSPLKSVLTKFTLKDKDGPAGYIAAPFTSGTSEQLACDGLAGGVDQIKHILGCGVFGTAIINLNAGGEGGGGSGGGGGGSAPSSGGEGPGGGQTWGQFAATQQMITQTAQMHANTSRGR